MKHFYDLYDANTLVCSGARTISQLQLQLDCWLQFLFVDQCTRYKTVPLCPESQKKVLWR